MAVFNRLQVLVVERDEAVRQAAISAAQTAGFVVQGCCNHLAPAWETVFLQKPDVVLVGSIAATSPEQVIEATRRWVHEYGIAVVNLVADASRAARVIDQHAGECVVTPFSDEQLAVSMRMAMARCRQIAEAKRDSTTEILQSLPEALIATDMTGRIMFANRMAQRLLHKESGGLEGLPLADAYHPLHLDGSPAPAVPDQHLPQAQIQSRLLLLASDSNSVEVIEDRHAVMRDGTGALSGMAVMFRALARKEATQRSVGGMGDSVTDPLLVLDAALRISFANQAVARMLGVTIEALTGRSLWEILPAQVRARHEEESVRAWQGQATHSTEWLLENTGAAVWYEVRSYPHQSGRILWLSDITSRKLEWEKGNRIDRLESLGLLARGFAHDFNNLLTVLLGNLSLAEQRFTKEGTRPSELHAARQATVQAQGLVQQLLTFARGGVPVKRSVSPTALVRQFFEQHPRVPGIQYVLEAFEETPVMAVDPNQIRRLLGNLMRNAEQASSQGGEIRVRCEAASSSSVFPGEVPADESAAVVGVLIEVEDHGEGIAPQHLAHVFEPYFTTRKSQNATGLGLTVCESIARAHGGTLNVYAVKPQGTRVRFFLPMEDETLQNEAADAGSQGGGILSSSSVHPVKPHPPRILVLEDDHLVRALLLHGLQHHGYDVTETLDGHDTVRLYERSLKEGQPYDLVILDLSIPNGMGGLRTMEKLRALDPKVLAMVSSGYSDDPAMAHPASYGFAAVLPKPYEPQELVNMVQQLLESRMNAAS